MPPQEQRSGLLCISGYAQGRNSDFKDKQADLSHQEDRLPCRDRGRLHQPGVPTITSITQRSVPGVAVGISFPRVGISVLSAFASILQPLGR